MIRVARPVAAVISALLLISLVAVVRPSSGQTEGDPSSVVREVVMTVLDDQGGVRSTTVASLVRLDGEGSEALVAVPDLTELKGFRSLSGFFGPVRTNGQLEWRSSGRKDTVSLAEVDKELPLEVHTRYYLDDEEMDARDLRGKKGLLRMEIELVNVSERSETLSYPAVSTPMDTRSARVYLPLEYSVIVDLPTDRWRRVEADTGYYGTDARGTQTVVRPGVLAPPLGPDRDTVVIEAYSDRIILPPVRIAAFPHVNPLASDAYGEQVDALRSLHGSLGTIHSTLGAVYGGTLQIIDGLEQMLPAVGVNDPVTGEPVVTLDASGTPTNLLGALGFIRNAIVKDMLPAIGTRDPRTGRAVVTLDSSGTPTTLIGAVGFIHDNIADLMLPALGRRDPATGRAIKEVDEFGRALTLLWGLQSGKDSYDNQLIPGMNDLIGAVDEIVAGLHTHSATDPGLVDGMEQLRDGLGELIANMSSGNLADPRILELLKLIDGANDGAIVNLNNSVTKINQLIAANPGLSASLQAVRTDVNNAKSDLEGVIAFFLKGFPALGVPSLIEAIGELNPDGTPKIVLDPETGLPTNVIGALGFMQAAIAQDVLPALGRTNPATGRPIVTLGPDGLPTTLLGALGYIRNVALTNPLFTQPSPILGGMVPKTYFNDCPACWDEDHPLFDPRTLHPNVQPAMLEAFHMFSEGLGAGLIQAHSLDRDNPGLIDGLELITEGLQEMIGALHTHSTTNPGLVDGLGLVEDGIKTLTDALHTHDVDDPGLVDGLELVRGGVQQVSQGLFAVNDLGVRLTRTTVGEQGDGIALGRALLDKQAEEGGEHTFLAAGADSAFTTYVFDLPGHATAGRDSAVRVALIAFTALGLALLGRRRLLGGGI